MLPFQRQALHRMLQAERHPLGVLSPLILRSARLGVPLYFSPLWPGARRTPGGVIAHGGLLCEEMGLGKTVVCMALILSNPLVEAVRCAEADHVQREGIVYGGAAAHEQHTRLWSQGGTTAERTTTSTVAVAAKRAAAATSLPAVDANNASKNDDSGLSSSGVPSGKGVALLPFSRAGNPSPTLLCKGTLVVCPLTLVSQWQAELAAHAPSLRVCGYHGSARPRQLTALAEYDVVLTSYATLVGDYNKEQQQLSVSNTPHFRLDESLSAPLHHLGWHRIILDESHMLQNKPAKHTRAIGLLGARFRWSVSATPGQTLDAISRHLQFLGLPSAVAAVSTLAYIATRHTVRQELDGQPVLQLPPQHLATVPVMLSAEETRRYAALRDSVAAVFRTLQANTGSVRDYNVHIVTLMHTLRLAASGGAEPALPRWDAGGVIAARLERITKKDPLLQLSNTFSTAVDAVVQCPVCLDVPDAAVVTPCNHVHCSPCIMALASTAFDADRTPCPACATVVRLKDLKHVVGNSASLALAGGAGERDAGESDAASEDGREDESHRHERQRRRTRRSRGRGGRGSLRASTRARGQLPTHDGDGGEMTQAAPTLRSLSAVPFTSKPRAALVLLKAIVEKEPESKVLVLSHFQATLDLLAHELPTQGFESRMLHGGMSRTGRSRALKEFAESSSRCVMLISMRAGFERVNLTAANHVVFIEPTVNPALRTQAVGRVYRLGQTRPVTVHVLVATGTLEESLHRIACEKAVAEQGRGAPVPATASGGGASSQTMSLFSDEELNNIFQC